jgi:hypothetical protein
MTMEDRKKEGASPQRPAVPDALAGDPHENSRRAEEIYGSKDRTEVEEANAEMRKQRSDRPSPVDEAPLTGGIIPPD